MKNAISSFSLLREDSVINDSLNVQGRIEGQRCNGPLAKILVHALLYALKERERTSVES